MKDLFNREIQVGNFIAYALTAGRSANLAIYEVKEVFPGSVKAHKIEESYGYGGYDVTLADGKVIPRKYAEFFYKSEKDHGYKEMTQAQKDKVDNKVTTISMAKRAFILDNFTPEVLKGVEQ